MTALTIGLVTRHFHARELDRVSYLGSCFPAMDL